jgi:hypothetical protein
LTEEENSVVLEKDRCLVRIKEISKERESLICKQREVQNSIQKLRISNIKHKLRGDILKLKLDDETKLMNELHGRILSFNNTEKGKESEISSFNEIICKKNTFIKSSGQKKKSKSYSLEIGAFHKKTGNKQKSETIAQIKNKRKVLTGLKNKFEILLLKE